MSQNRTETAEIQVIGETIRSTCLRADHSCFDEVRKRLHICVMVWVLVCTEFIFILLIHCHQWPYMILCHEWTSLIVHILILNLKVIKKVKFSYCTTIMLILNNNTVEPHLADTLEIRTSTVKKTLCMVPNVSYVSKTTLEIRTPL